MTSELKSHVMGGQADVVAGVRAALSCAAGWLALAAMPTFALMALWSSLSGGMPEMLCMQHASPLNSMTVMYALMSAFHGGPWLRLATGRP